MFAVVEFAAADEESQNEIAVVPLIWLHKQERYCYWPNKINTKNFTEFVKGLPNFKSAWPRYKVFKVHFKSESYEESDKYVEGFLKENQEEAEASGKSNATISRKTLCDAETTQNLDSYHSTPTRSYRASPSTSSFSETFTNRTDQILEKVLQLTTKIAANVDQQNIILNEILKNSKNSNLVSLDRPNNMPDFPINNLEAFQQFNDRIQKDNNFERYMISRLSSVGGSGVESHTRRMLKFLITDDVALNFNWKGRDKLAFESKPIMKTIYEAAKMMFPDNEKNDFNVANAVKNWLKFAKARLSKKSN